MRLLLAIVLIGVAVTPARADWQGFEWGSPTEEVPSTYMASAGIEFAVNAQGVDGALKRIVLVPSSLMQCQFVLETALGIYGPAARSQGEDGSLDQWRDETNDNLVYFWLADDGASCSLTYEPLLKPNAPGSL